MYDFLHLPDKECPTPGVDTLVLVQIYSSDSHLSIWGEPSGDKFLVLMFLNGKPHSQERDLYLHSPVTVDR